jgi:hypothetical protein
MRPDAISSAAAASAWAIAVVDRSMARMCPVVSRPATARAAAPGPHPISRTREYGRSGSASTIAARRGDKRGGTGGTIRDGRAAKRLRGHHLGIALSTFDGGPIVTLPPSKGTGMPARRRTLACALTALLLVVGLVGLPGAASADVVFTDDFEDGVANGWQFTGGRWALSSDGSRVLRQSRTGGPARAESGDPTWRGYTLTARVKPTSLGAGQSAAGIAARVDGDAAYLLALRPGNRIELIRSAGGQRTVLAHAALTMRTGHWYGLSLRVDDDRLDASVTGRFGSATLTATDASLAAGAIALFTDRAAASFDDVAVDAVEPPRDTQPPSAPGPPRVLEVTPTTATITWPAATDNVGVTGYIVFFGSQFYEEYPVRQVTGTEPVTVPLGGSTGATLHVSVRAVDAAGNQSPMSARTFFPQPPSFPRSGDDTVPPSAPGAPVVTGVGEGGVVITWPHATDDTGVVEYHVVHAFYVDEVRVRAKVPGTTNTAVVPMASFPNQVGIIAYDASWNSARSATVTLTTPPTPPPPTPPPPAPAGR